MLSEHQIYTRLEPKTKICYLRGMETFPAEDGQIDEHLQRFLTSIMEGSEDFDAPTIQNAINFARTFYELGHVLPQTVLNKIFISAVRFPTLVPQLTLFSHYYKSNSWLYSAILKALVSIPNLFMQSLAKSEPVWDFLIEKFNEDFNSKISQLDSNYYDQTVSFLFESVIIGWDFNRTSLVSFENLLTDFVEFCNLYPESTAAKSMLNFVFSIMPELVISKAKNISYWISIQNLRIVYMLGLNTSHKIDGSPLSLAIKLISVNKDEANKIISQCDKESQNVFRQLITHLDNEFDTFNPNF